MPSRQDSSPPSTLASEPVAWTALPVGRVFGVPVPVVFFALAALAVATVDAPVARARLSLQLPESFSAALDRMETFGHGVGVVLVAAAAWALDRTGRRRLPRLLAATCTAGLLANLGKLLIARQRPFWWADQGTGLANQFVGWLPLGGNASLEQSFPSGHTSTAVALALALSALYPNGRVVFLTTAGLVAFQRVVFDAHYVSDVLAACGLAWLVVRSFYCLPAVSRHFDRIERRCEPAVSESQPAVRRVA